MNTKNIMLVVEQQKRDKKEKAKRNRALRLYKKYLQLQKLARKASDAQYKFEIAFERAKERTKEWEEMCEAHGVAPESNLGDWLC